MKSLKLIIALAMLPAAALAEDYIARNDQGQAEGLFRMQFEQPVAMGARGQALRSAVAGAGGPVAGAVDLSIANLTRLAREFLAGQRQLLDLDGPEQLELMRYSRDDYGNTHLRFARTYKGILVDPMDLLVHFDDSGRVTSINGNIVRLPDEMRTALTLKLVGDTPTLTAEQAQAFVAKDLGVAPDRLRTGEAKPLIIAQEPYVIWEVRASAGHTPYRYRISDEASPRVLVKDLDLRF